MQAIEVSVKLALSGEKGAGKFALVDAKYFDALSQYKWHLNSGGYASNSTLGLMHRAVVNLTRSVDGLPPLDEDMLVDHLDGNRLNNTIRNLSPKTSKGNAKNRTNDPVHDGLTGVVKVPLGTVDGADEGTTSGTYVTVHRKVQCYSSTDARMCALCYDSVVTYCYGPGKRINDLKSPQPLDIMFWHLSEDVMAKLDKFKEKHTDFIGVKKTRDGWRATITVDLGEFESDVNAALAYDKAFKALNLNPKASQLNFP